MQYVLPRFKHSFGDLAISVPLVPQQSRQFCTQLNVWTMKLKCVIPDGNCICERNRKTVVSFANLQGGQATIVENYRQNVWGKIQLNKCCVYVVCANIHVEIYTSMFRLWRSKWIKTKTREETTFIMTKYVLARNQDFVTWINYYIAAAISYGTEGIKNMITYM